MRGESFSIFYAHHHAADAMIRGPTAIYSALPGGPGGSAESSGAVLKPVRSASCQLRKSDFVGHTKSNKIFTIFSLGVSE